MGPPREVVLGIFVSEKTQNCTDMTQFKRIISLVLAILVAIILVGGIVCTIIAAVETKMWPVYVALPVLVLFAWGDVYRFMKACIDNFREDDL